MAEDDTQAAVEEPLAPVADASAGNGAPPLVGVEGVTVSDSDKATAVAALPSDPLAGLDDDTLSGHAKVQGLLQRAREEEAGKAEERATREITTRAQNYLRQNGFMDDAAKVIKHYVDSGEEFNPASINKMVEMAWHGLAEYTQDNIKQFLNSFIPDTYAIPAARQREIVAAERKAAQGDTTAANRALTLQIQTYGDAVRADERAKVKAELEPELRAEIEKEVRQDTTRTSEEKERNRPRQTAIVGTATGTGGKSYSNLLEAQALHARGELDNATMRDLKFKADRGQFPKGW